MTRHFVLTVTGPDLPGMEQELTQLISRHQAQWVASRMAHMAGRFASILFISVGGRFADALTIALNSLQVEGVDIRIDRVESSPTYSGEHHLLMNLIADDAPQLVTDVSRLLDEQCIRISELHTDTLPAPYTGEMMQSIQAHLRAPSGVDVDAVRSRIESLSPELMLDLCPE